MWLTFLIHISLLNTAVASINNINLTHVRKKNTEEKKKIEWKNTKLITITISK